MILFFTPAKFVDYKHLESVWCFEFTIIECIIPFKIEDHSSK